MGDRPMIFSGPMVRALIDGRKTQTRRVLKPQPPEGARFSGTHFASGEADSWFWNSPFGPFKLPEKYAPGDRLWVREAWGLGVSDHGDCPRYKATMDYQCGDKIKSEHEGPFQWRSPIHMPRWASRLTLLVTDVRVQRVQEISEDDARAEGLTPITKDGNLVKWGIPDRDGLPGTDNLGWPWDRWDKDPRMAFRTLWNSIHDPDAWTANSWVAAVTFTVERRNIDA